MFIVTPYHTVLVPTYRYVGPRINDDTTPPTISVQILPGYLFHYLHIGRSTMRKGRRRRRDQETLI